MSFQVSFEDYEDEEGPIWTAVRDAAVWLVIAFAVLGIVAITIYTRRDLNCKRICPDGYRSIKVRDECLCTEPAQ